MSSEDHGRQESWDEINRLEASRGDSYSEGEYDDLSTDDGYNDTESPARLPPLVTIADVQRALHPLQATADRVGKQVERFAENLDRLSIKSLKKSQKDCRNVLPLVLSYKKIAHNTVEHLKAIHEPEAEGQTTKRWKRKLRSSGGSSTPGSICTTDDLGMSLGLDTTVEDLKRWEQEEHTWSLLGLMLQVEYPIPRHDVTKPEFDQGFSRPDRIPEIHRFSSERDVWNNFLAEDDLAWERHTVVEWLKKCSDNSRQNIDRIIQDLESDADRGSGLWAHSWLYSKEAIKGQKRLKAWSHPVDPEAPGIDTSILINDHTKGLVTQLDPDAITRQERSLAKQDHYFERAIWLACWEMVRRGKDWNCVREWCQERVEGWRALAIMGDARCSNSRNERTEPERSLVTKWQSRALWRKTCAIAAKNGGIDKYENAIYGALSGYLPSVKAVSSSWDDYLFAHYNSYLLRQFDRYIVSHFSDRLPSASVDRYGSFDFSISAGQRAQSGNQIVQKMMTLARTGKEAREPFKLLQGSLVAKAFEDFISTYGVQLSLSANRSGKSKILPTLKSIQPEDKIAGIITMNDYDLLRIITHILFAFQDLGLDLGEGIQRIAAENFVVAYVDYLSKAGKQQLLPLYASRLSPSRSITCLGRQLPFVRDDTERQTMMRLMKKNGLDIPGVLSMQLELIISDNPPKGVEDNIYPKLDVLDSKKDEKSMVYPIRNEFIGKSVSDDEQDLISGFEWYLLLDGHWQQTMDTGTILYKHLLRTSGLAAAKELSIAVPFSKISIHKTQRILGRTEDISQKLEDSDDEGEVNHIDRDTKSRHFRNRLRRRSSSAVRSYSQRQLLLLQSRTFRDFEALFAVLDAMEKWQGVAVHGNSFVDSRKDKKIWITRLQDAYEKVDALIGPLLHGWLQYPKDDDEAAEFEKIREACLPEVLLAYNTILNFSNYYISRDVLVKSMDMATIVAAKDSDLGASFMAAGRMPELMDSLALSSRNMIQGEERGSRISKSKKKLGGETLDLWVVRAPPTSN